MQLLIILVLLLYGGSNCKNLLNEVKPVLESLGGEDMQRALQSAEEISQVLSAVSSFTNAKSGEKQCCDDSQSAAYPLAPVCAIADGDITYSLNKYIQENG